MKTIGLIGGMSWESTADYYRLINEKVSRKLGGLHSAEIIMHSVDFDPVEKLQREDRWDDIGARIAEIARTLERSGAEFIVICTNATHRVADTVAKSITIPLLHIADATAQAICTRNLKTVGLLGSIYLSKYPFYRETLESSGISVMMPGKEDMELVNSVIYDELCRGVIDERSKAEVLGIVEKLAGLGAEGIVLACTELPLLIRPDDVNVPLFNTVEIHAEAAVTFCC